MEGSSTTRSSTTINNSTTYRTRLVEIVPNTTNPFTLSITTNPAPPNTRLVVQSQSGGVMWILLGSLMIAVIGITVVSVASISLLLYFIKSLSPASNIPPTA